MNKYLIIHHTAVSREKVPAQFYAVNRYHKEKWGMKSTLGYYIGYTHFIGTNGVITQTRTLEEEGVHTKSYNKGGHIGLCLAGNFNVELPNEKQIKSLRKFIKEHKDFEIKFHNELGDTSCPGHLFTREYLNNVILDNKNKLSNSDKEKQNGIAFYSSTLKRLRELLLSLLSKIQYESRNNQKK